MTTDFETELRHRLGDAADGAAGAADPLPAVERRLAARRRRAAALRVAGVVAVVALAAGGAVALTAGDDGGEPTEAAASTDPAGPSASTGSTLVPLTPGWAAMADAPIESRFGHATVAMGDEVLVWGGQPTATARQGDAPGARDGAVYDPAHDTWRTIPPGPGLGSMALGVWTGEVAILVGGPELGGGGPRVAAAFDPSDDTWTELAPPPDGNAADAVTHLVWTGTEVILVTGGASTPDQVVAYDPATDTWREGALPATPLPAFAQLAWTGSEVVVIGFDMGIGDQAYSVNGDTDGDGDLMDPDDPPPVDQSPTVGQTVVHLYDPAADTWRSIPWGLGAARRSPVVAWTGDALLVGGGGGSGADHADAALLDPATGTWTPLPAAPVPFSASGREATVWTGDQVLVPTSSLPGDPAEADPGDASLGLLAYDAGTGTWTQAPTAPVPPPQGSRPVWAAGRLVAPLGGLLTRDGPGSWSCCDHGPAGGLTYTP